MLIVGNYIKNIKCESFLDVETNRIRIRPLNDQGIPTDLVIECLREYTKTSVYLALRSL